MKLTETGLLTAEHTKCLKVHGITTVDELHEALTERMTSIWQILTNLTGTELLTLRRQLKPLVGPRNRRSQPTSSANN